MVARVADTIGTLFDALPDLTAQELAEKPEGMMVQVPAAVLAELRAAHDEVLKLRAKPTDADQGTPDASA